VRKTRSERPAPPRAAPPRTPFQPAAPSAPRRDRPGPTPNANPNANPNAMPTATPGAMPSASRPGLGSPASPRSEPSPLRMQTEVVADDGLRPATPGSARARLLNARTSPVPREGLRSFRNVVNEVDDLGAATARSAQSARDTRDSYGATPAQQFSDDEEELPPVRDRLETHFLDDEAEDFDDDTAQARVIEPADDLDEDATAAAAFARPHTSRAREPEHYTEPRPPRSYRGLAKLAVVLIILAGLTATISWQWSNISGLYNFVSHMRSKPTQTAQAPAAEPKFPGRVPQEQLPGQQQAPAAGAPAGQNAPQNAPQVAQRVVLYEEDPNNPQGRQFVGSAVWRTETVSPGSGLAPELEVRADVTIPDRNMTVTWTLRRNTDQALPASHTIEIMFNLPPDFPGGGIANVPGVLMKDSEQARGVPLAGLAVKVTNGFFLIGLSAVDTDVQRNIQLLKDKPWFDIPIVYNNGGRAILAMEKGPPGDRAFADAFAAWAK
jgi:hypothetical protein